MSLMIELKKRFFGLPVLERNPEIVEVLNELL